MRWGIIEKSVLVNFYRRGYGLRGLMLESSKGENWCLKICVRSYTGWYSRLSEVSLLSVRLQLRELISGRWFQVRKWLPLTSAWEIKIRWHAGSCQLVKESVGIERSSSIITFRSPECGDVTQLVPIRNNIGQNSEKEDDEQI